MDAGFLEYGAVGLLALVLGGVGLFLRGYLTREQERQDERDKESRQDQRDLNRSFQELVAQDVEAKQKLSATLDGLCAETKANQNSLTVAIAELVEGQRAHEDRASERHEKRMEMDREIVASLKALNGHPR